jgi:hypothetical protein
VGASFKAALCPEWFTKLMQPQKLNTNTAAEIMALPSSPAHRDYGAESGPLMALQVIIHLALPQRKWTGKKLARLTRPQLLVCPING